MPDSQPGRFLFLAYRSACHPSSLPLSSRFVLSPRKTRPLRSSGMVSSTNAGAAASFIKWTFPNGKEHGNWSACSCSGRADVLKRFLISLRAGERWSNTQEDLPRREIASPGRRVPAVPTPVLCCHPAAAPVQGQLLLHGAPLSVQVIVHWLLVLWK